MSTYQINLTAGQLSTLLGLVVAQISALREKVPETESRIRFWRGQNQETVLSTGATVAAFLKTEEGLLEWQKTRLADAEALERQILAFGWTVSAKP